MLVRSLVINECSVLGALCSRVFVHHMCSSISLGNTLSWMLIFISYYGFEAGMSKNTAQENLDGI